MKFILILFVSVELLIGSVYLLDTKSELVKALATDIVNELKPHNNARHARHIQIATEAAIDHFLDNLRMSYEKRNMSSNVGLNRAVYELRKKMKALKARMQKKRDKKKFNNTANKTTHAPYIYSSTIVSTPQ